MTLHLDLRADPSPAVAPACARCGASDLRPGRITTVFRRGTGLVVIDDIPALVCPGCGEEHVDDETATRLDLMRGSGLGLSRRAGTILVPVFHFEEVEG